MKQSLIKFVQFSLKLEDMKKVFEIATNDLQVSMSLNDAKLSIFTAPKNEQYREKWENNRSLLSVA